MTAMDAKVGVALIGVTGYGNSHIQSILAAQEAGVCRWVAACDRDPDRLTMQAEVLSANEVKTFTDLNAMLDAIRGDVQVIGIPVGIPYHADLSIRCMEAGFHVICEKPPAPTVQQVDAMIDASARTDRFCQIGFQRSWSVEFLALRELICSGTLGAVKSIRMAGWWKRADAYYARNAWAGCLRYGDQWVLDGTINNPFAHQIQAALHLASTEDAPTTPKRVRAELYHCREITGDDTSSVAIETGNGATIHTYFTLCTERPDQGPIWFRIEGEKGTIETVDGKAPLLSLGSGERRELPTDDGDARNLVYRDTCRHLLTGELPQRCPVAYTRPFTVAVNGAFESAGPPRAIAPEFLSHDTHQNSPAYRLAGVDDAIQRGYETGKLFSELGVPWATTTDWVDVANYTRFDPTW